MNRIRAIQLIAVHFFCVLLVQSYAQNMNEKDSLITSKIMTLDGFWKKYNELSQKEPVYESTGILPDVFKVSGTDTNSRTVYLNKANDAEISRLKNNFGLAAVANYQENFNPGIGAQDELVYKRRFQAGLDWNVLGDGYLSNRYKQQVLKNQKIINSLTPQVKISANDYLIISHKVIYAFNQHKIKLLEERQQIINDKMETANELYLMKHLPKLDIMQIIQQQVDVSSMFQIYRSYNEQLSQQINAASLPAGILPLFDIDPEKISEFTGSSANDSILKLQIKNLSLENNVWKDINVKTQLHYNYYDINNKNLTNRDFFSAGLSVSVPLPLGVKTSNNLVSSKADLMRFDLKNNSVQKNLELLNSVYDFRYKLKQYNNFYEKHKKYEELIRIERVKEKLDDLEFNPVTALNLIDEMLSVEIEMLDLQQEMYLQLLDLIVKTPGIDALSVIQPYHTMETKLPATLKQTSIYIWSDAQTKYSADYIVEYLKLNKISNAIISVKKDGRNKTEAIELINKCFSASIRSEVLIGSNEMLTEKDPVSHITLVLKDLDLSKISALHLDVEPHALPDWQDNKEKYLKMYTDLLSKVKIYCDEKKIKLSVSIPVFYPEETLKLIYEQADNVYVMAYEHPDADYIIRKVKEELSQGADKTIVALRAADFKNRNEFEKVMNDVAAVLNSSKFALHDLESFVKLDELNVGGENKK